MTVGHIARRPVHRTCLRTSATVIISCRKEEETGQITPTELQADLTVITMDSRKAILEKARLLDYSALRGRANLRDLLLCGVGIQGEGGREEGCHNHCAPSLSLT